MLVAPQQQQQSSHYLKKKKKNTFPPDISDDNDDIKDASKRKIVMGFPFFHEFEVFKERILTLQGVVDCMIVAESRYSHSGEDKGLHFEREILANKNEHRLFEMDSGRRMGSIQIVHIVDNSTNNYSDKNKWGQEIQSRSFIGQGLSQCNPGDNDIVVITDADEYIDSMALLWMRRHLKHNMAAFVDLKWFLHNKCWLNPRPTRVPVAATYKTLRDSMHNDPQQIRASRGNAAIYPLSYEYTKYAGYHCSWCFSPSEGDYYNQYRMKIENLNPGDNPNSVGWMKQEWSDQQLDHLRKNGLWLDGVPHGKFVC